VIPGIDGGLVVTGLEAKLLLRRLRLLVLTMLDLSIFPQQTTLFTGR